MEDEIKGAYGELQKVNIGGLGQSRPVKISKDLPEEEKKKMTKLLRDFKDIFAWEYGEMLGLDLVMVSHKLNINPNVCPVN